MKRSLRVLMVGGLVAAGLSLPAAPAHALCAGVMMGPEQHLGVWTCESCPDPVHGPIDGRFQVVVCLLNR